MTDIFDARLAREIQYEKQRQYLDRYEDPSILRSRLLQAQRDAAKVPLSKPLLKQQKKRKTKVGRKKKTIKGETAREKRLMKIFEKGQRREPGQEEVKVVGDDALEKRRLDLQERQHREQLARDDIRLRAETRRHQEEMGIRRGELAAARADRAAARAAGGGGGAPAAGPVYHPPVYHPPVYHAPVVGGGGGGGARAERGDVPRGPPGRQAVRGTGWAVRAPAPEPEPRRRGGADPELEAVFAALPDFAKLQQDRDKLEAQRIEAWRARDDKFEQSRQLNLRADEEGRSRAAEENAKMRDELRQTMEAIRQRDKRIEEREAERDVLRRERRPSPERQSRRSHRSPSQPAARPRSPEQGAGELGTVQRDLINAADQWEEDVRRGFGRVGREPQERTTEWIGDQRNRIIGGRDPIDYQNWVRDHPPPSSPVGARRRSPPASPAVRAPSPEPQGSPPASPPVRRGSPVQSPRPGISRPPPSSPEGPSQMTPREQAAEQAHLLRQPQGGGRSQLVEEAEEELQRIGSP